MEYARLHLFAIPRMRASLPSNSLDMDISVYRSAGDLVAGGVVQAWKYTGGKTAGAYIVHWVRDRMDLTTPLTYVKGIGPARAAMLQAKVLSRSKTCSATSPSATKTAANMKTIAQLAPGEMATVIADVSSAKLSGFRRRNLGLFEVRFTDRSRATLACKWFPAAIWPTCSPKA